MATTYKVLAQSNPTATTNTDVYTVPSATQTIVSTLTVCNQANTNATYNVAVRKGGAALATQHYIAYGATVQANNTTALTLGMTLAATDVITIQASTSTISFTVFGSEIA